MEALALKESCQKRIQTLSVPDLVGPEVTSGGGKGGFGREKIVVQYDRRRGALLFS